MKNIESEKKFFLSKKMKGNIGRTEKIKRLKERKGSQRNDEKKE